MNIKNLKNRFSKIKEIRTVNANDFMRRFERKPIISVMKQRR